MLIIGLISGTSADGTAAAVVRIEGAPPALKWELLAHMNVPHPPDLRAQIFASFRPETGTVDRLCALNFALGRAFADAASQVAAAAGLALAQVDLIGSHGQTVWHIPDGPEASTLQLGEPAVIAELTGLPVVSNFRTRDMAAGGQGAPLVSYVDRLLFSHPTRSRALQNIGGIGNVTYLPPLPPPSPENSPVTQSTGLLRAAPQAQASGLRYSAGRDLRNPPDDDQGKGGEVEVAFDTGPGNMLMDYAAGRATNGAWEYDHDGVLAAQGRVDEALLAELMAEPYLRLPAPKTTGRELFGVQFGLQVWERAKAAGLADVDILATLTAFTAASIAQAYRELLPRMPDEVIVSGGGAQNPTLMAMLRAALLPSPEIGGGGGGVSILTTDDFGLPAEAKEAVAFAVLAHETWHGRPGNLPAATGAQRAVVLGNITPGDERRKTKDEGRKPESLVPSPQFPLTELRNPATEEIDTLSTLDMVRLINAEDSRVAAAVEMALPAVAEAIDRIAERMERGGRLIYTGAGTSGRLAVLDAAECPPTFGTRPEQVVALIAGGGRAITQAVEGVEDDALAGERDLAALNPGELDSVVGVAASGRTPYVLGAMQEARRRGALVISLACSRPSPMEELADIAIALLVGPEVITGSTRLKAGTAQKLALNMLSTGVMIRLGKTYGNLMVDVQATNIKLRVRARRIVEQATGLSSDAAAALLHACGGEVKVAIVAALAGVAPDEARQRLVEMGGVVRNALLSRKSSLAARS